MQNPAYRDMMYFEVLIGSDIVNTMPLKTIESFRDHGRVRLSIEDHLHEAKAQLASLEDVGIHYNQIAQQLYEEGM
jgi:transaldolase